MMKRPMMKEMSTAKKPVVIKKTVKKAIKK